MNYAIIKNNTVSNVIVWDQQKNPDYTPEGVAIAIGDGIMVSIGWKYEGGQFIDPNPPTQNQE